MSLSERCYDSPAVVVNNPGNGYGTGGYMPYAVPVMQSGSMGNGNGFGNAMNGDGAWFLLILFLFALSGNWGNNRDGGNGGGNGMIYPILTGNSGTGSEVQRGFDQSAIMSGLSGIQNAVTNGFSSAEISRCNGQSAMLQAINSAQMGFYQNSNANQNALIAAINNVLQTFTQCCCDEKAAIADLKYTISSEECDTRNQFQQSMQNLLTAVNVNAQSIINNQNAGVQAIKDEFCQDRLDRKDETIAALRSENQTLRFDRSQVAQTASVNQYTATQIAALQQYLNNQNGCGCGGTVYSGCSTGCGN